ncbi:hypothetical protein A2U01_0096491, partial [Trifolium medium]|nr:hypothetical protein [Trifolium medium]
MEAVFWLLDWSSPLSFFLSTGQIANIVGPPIMDAKNDLLPGSLSSSLSSVSFPLMASTLSFGGEPLF